MTPADKLKNNLFYLLAGGLFTLAVSGATLSSTYIRLSQSELILTAFVAVGLFCLLLYNRYTLWIGLGTLTASLLVLFIYLHGKDYAVPWFERLSRFALELWQHIRGLSVYTDRYAVLGTAIIVLFALFTAAVIRSGMGFYCLSALGFGVFAVLAYFEYNTPREYLLYFLFIFAVLLARRMSRTAARQGGDLALNISGLLLLPICLVLVFVAGRIPQPAAAQGRDIKDNVLVNLGALDEVLYSAFTPKYFNFSTTGFSGAGGRLGGNVQPNDRYVMEVYTSEGTWPYLAGAYKDTYEGDRWSWSGEAWELPVFEETYVGWHDVGDNDLMVEASGILADSGGQFDRQDYIDTYADYSKLVTVINGRGTRAVFIPARSLALIYQGEQRPLAATFQWINTPRRALSMVYKPSPLVEVPGFSLTSGGGIQADRTMDAGTVYTASYREDWYIERSGQQEFPDDPNLSAALAPYLALPDDLPQRVRDLAQAVVDRRGAQTPYEKMAALESYLQQFPYTLEPGGLPAGEDFVDYFLFEIQSGYCTYYASALAVMGRCVGVPTRYAEGYVLPGEQNDQGGYDVTNAQAHAWCEALFPIGSWTAFEATAPYNYAFYHGGAAPPAHDTYSAEDYLQDFEEFDEDDLMAEIRERNREQGNTAPVLAEAEAGETGDAGGRIGWFLLTLALLLLAAGAVCGVRYQLYQRRLRALAALPNKQAAQAYYGRILGLMAARGSPMLAGETASAYAARMDGHRGGEGAMNRLSDIFCRASYSAGDISDTERDAMAGGYTGLLRQDGGQPLDRAKAWFERFVLGKY